MPFVKLDSQILTSTLWLDLDARTVFLTALLMAEPIELDEPAQEIEIRSLDNTDFWVPAGWYGFVPAAGVGIIRNACLEREPGLAALERLASPEPDSRNPKFDGRRMVRINGGFIILNYMDFRDRDYTAAERSRRYRERKKKKQEEEEARRHAAAQRRHAAALRGITQAEAEAEAEEEGKGVGVVGSEGVGVAVVDSSSGKGSGEIDGSKGKKEIVVRDNSWVEHAYEQLAAKDWSIARAKNEAMVAFKFHRWRNNTKARTLFNPKRERIAVKLIEEYGLVAVLMAIEGQLTHPDKNPPDGRSYRTWDHLFQAENGPSNIEKCRDHAIARGNFKYVLRTLEQLKKERGWEPSELDQELWETIAPQQGGGDE